MIQPEALLVAAMVGIWAPPLLDMLLSIVHALALRPAGGGDGRRGLAVFVEPTRAFGVRWGARQLAAGLRRAGFEGEFRYWPWQEAWRAWLILPVILGRKTLGREAGRLAAFIAESRRAQPDRPIYVIGYSAGGYVAAAALAQLPQGVAADAAALLAPAFDPRRDLAPAADRVRGNLVVASSLLDWFIIGLCPLLLGTCDRRHTPSAGSVGLRGEQPANVIEVKWRPAMIGLAHWGGHFGVTAPGFIARHVAPLLDVASVSCAPAEPEQRETAEP